jgi:hypothetical protein
VAWLVIGSTGHLLAITTSYYNSSWIYTVYNSLWHTWSSLSLLYLHQSLLGNISPHCRLLSFHVHVLTSCQLSQSHVWPPLASTCYHRLGLTTNLELTADSFSTVNHWLQLRFSPRYIASGWAAYKTPPPTILPLLCVSSPHIPPMLHQPLLSRKRVYSVIT